MWIQLIICLQLISVPVFGLEQLKLRSYSKLFHSAFSQISNQEEKRFFRNSISRILSVDRLGLDKSNYTKIINLLPFYGNWYSTDCSEKTFELFESYTGYLEVSSPYSDAIVDEPMWNVEFDFFDGPYQDQRYLKIKVKEPVEKFDFNQANATFKGNHFNFEITYGNNRRPYFTKNCLTDVTISFIDLQTFGPFNTTDGKDAEDIGLWIFFESSQCSLSISSTILKISDVNTKELIIYILIMLSAASIGMFSVNKLIDNFPDNINKLARVSLWSIWLINAWDFYLFLYHIALSVGMSGWLMIVALAFFSLSIMSETKLVYAIYVSTYHAQMNSNIATGCKFFAVYYGMLYFMVFSYTYFTTFIWIILSSSFFLVFQIILVYQRGRKYKFNFWHLLGLSATKISFVTYIKVYPTNIFRLSPDLEFASIYFGIIIYQILILCIQKMFPKFCFTPKPYKYFVKIVNLEEKEEVCPICMEALKEEVPNINSKPLLGNKQKNDKPITVMQTPCKHRYHETCLREWMKNKLECPSCRQVIPSLNNEEP